MSPEAKCPKCKKVMHPDSNHDIYCFACLMKQLTPEQKKVVDTMTAQFIRTLISPAGKIMGFSISGKVDTTIGTETGRISSKKVEQKKAIDAMETGKCCIPSNNVGICDLEWGHEGMQHSNNGDGFYAPAYREEHQRRQRERKKDKEG